MKIYKVKVNGKFYEVILEEVLEETEIETEFEEDIIDSPDELVVKAPMQGVILEISVNIGDEVSKGDQILVLEAMKMENEIFAPVDGKIKRIHVEKGQTVNLNDILVEME